MTAWLSGAEVLVTAGPPTFVDVTLAEAPPREVWDPLARAVACWAYRHAVITATPPVEVEFRARRRLDTGAVDFITFHHASVSADVLETCRREPEDHRPSDLTLSPKTPQLLGSAANSDASS